MSWLASHWPWLLPIVAHVVDDLIARSPLKANSLLQVIAHVLRALMAPKPLVPLEVPQAKTLDATRHVDTLRDKP